jgi:hypothetical protein
MPQSALASSSGVEKDALLNSEHGHGRPTGSALALVEMIALPTFAGQRGIDADRKSVHYRSIRNDDGTLRGKLRELAHQRRWCGYRRLQILLRKEGVMINWKKPQRLYREEGLAATQP